MIEGSGAGFVPLTNGPDPEPGGLKISGSATLVLGNQVPMYKMCGT